MRSRSHPPDTPASPPPPRRESKHKRGPDIITDIPLDEDEDVDQVMVTQHKKQILVTSKSVHIPLPPAPQHVDKHMDTIPSTPECDGDVYLDEEGVELLPATRNRKQKSPSRSVSVSPLAHTIFVLTLVTNNNPDTNRRVAEVPR